MQTCISSCIIITRFVTAHDWLLTFVVNSQDNFKRWNDALQEKNFKKVAALYSTNELSFLPTVSPEFIRDAKSTKEYFTEFLKKLPEGTITSDNVQAFSENAYLHTGMYTFMTGPKDNRTPVQARFSYFWKNVDGKWMITHHHSSAVPAAGAPPEAVKVAETNFDVGTVSPEEAAAEKIVIDVE
jgi:uncharacterized protein (TIGR02246 family)